MSTLITKQHDLEPPVYGQLKNADGSAINLTTATNVYFLMRLVSGGPTLRAAAVVVTANPNFTSSPDAQHVTYTWGATDTAVAGVYDQEWEITWPTARPMTVPNHLYNTVIIEDDLD